MGDAAVDNEFTALLTEKARSVLSRPFSVGRVRADTCQPGDEPFIGSTSIDFEARGYDRLFLLKAAAELANRLVEADLVVGTRWPPEITAPIEGSDELTLFMRLMCAPDKQFEVREKLVNSKAVLPYG